MGENEVMRAFGDRVREIRGFRGWSQEELSHRVGLDRSYIGGVERGERNISLKNIHAIAAALGVPTARLFDQEIIDATQPPRV